MPSAPGNSSSELSPAASRSPGRLAMVAALPREVSQLVRNWKVVERPEFRFFEHAGLVLICGGMGAEAARRATEAVVHAYRPEAIVSVGFAGALRADLKVGDVLRPRFVIDARDGSRHDTGGGQGALLTIAEIANGARKAKLAEAYPAQAVDMEAAAVARGAETHGIRFRAIKVISDRLDFSMPPLEAFRDGAGQFRTRRFALYAAFRPWWWRSVLELGRNSSRAARVLRKTLEQESIFGMAASNPGDC